MLSLGNIWTSAVFIGADPIGDGFNSPESPRFRFNDVPVQFSRAPVHTIADPFVITGPDDQLYLFAETCRDGQSGQIDVWNLSSGRAELIHEKLNVDPGHASFPFVFKHDGSHYLVPETGTSREGRRPEVALYHFADFPTHVEKVATLLEGEFVDSFILSDDGYHYLFTSDGEVARLFVSDAICGPYDEHPYSPFSGDSRFLRNAGAALPPNTSRPFWIRPAQNCSESYGGDLNLMRITTLSPEVYSEEPWAQNILAGEYSWSAGGGHHISQCRWREQTVTAVDGQQRNKILNSVISAACRCLPGTLLVGIGKRTSLMRSE